MICPHCGRELTPVAGQKYCSFCGTELDASQEAPSPASDNGPDEARSAENLDAPWLRVERVGYCPWEDQESLGFVQGMWQTLRQSVFSPDEFFGRIPTTGGYINPLLYALIVDTTGTFLSYLWAFSANHPFFVKLDLGGPMAIIAGVAVPIFVFLSIIISALLLHLSVFLVGGVKEDFEATFRVTCYSAGPELFNAIPLIGGLVGIVWKIYLMIIGLREVHGLSTARSALAVLMPSLLCCGVSLAAGAGLMMLMG